MGPRGTNNLGMTGRMGGYGGMMDPMSIGMMGMGSMGMGMGYGMTMGMGMGLATMMAPTMINRATASIGNAASGIAKAVVSGHQLAAINSRRAKRSKEEKPSEDNNNSKGADEDGEKKSTSKPDNLGTDDGKKGDGEKEGEKEKFNDKDKQDDKPAT
uniref:Uncharacterized protein n=1 Tax=Rhipicephalus zambeziensis TaxID=60191 RepID=A0A224YER1_9ACAR